MSVLLALLLVQEDVAALIRQLGSEGVEERDAARRELKALGKAALPELGKAAKGADVEVAVLAGELVRAIELLQRFSPEFRKANPGVEDRLAAGADAVWTQVFLEIYRRRAKEPLRHRFVPGDFEPLALRALNGAAGEEDREAVCRRIGYLGLRSAGAAIRERLGDRSSDVRRAAAFAAGRLGDREAIPEIVRLIETGPEGDRDDEDFFVALQELKARPELKAFLQSPKAAHRAQALGALWNLILPEDEAEIRKALKDPDGSVRRSALGALARLSEEKAEAPAVAMLEDPHLDVRELAFELVRVRRPQEAIPALRKLLESAEDAVDAAEVLGLLQVPEGKRKLLEILRDPGHEKRMRVMGSLASIGAKEAIPDLRAILKDPSFVLRQVAVQSLAELGAKEAIPELRALLQDPKEQVQSAAIDALLDLDAREAVDDLAALIDSPVHGGEAVAALAHLGARDRIPLLVKTLGHAGASQRASAIWALRRLGAKEQAPKILERLGDANADVRMEAVEAIGRFGLREAAAALEQRLADEDKEVAELAAAWLCALGSRAGIPALLQRGGERIVYLNALRAPELWSRMAPRFAEGKKEGTYRELAEELARQGGGRIEWPKEPAEDLAKALADRGSLADFSPRDAMPLLEHLAYLIGEGSSFLFEGDRIRVLPREEALEFWKAWSSNGGGK